MGEAVGGHLRKLSERVLVIGSGGLSHDPPVPQWAFATPAQRDMLLNGRHPTAAARAARPEAMAADAGNSAHEVRTWLAAFAALGAAGPYEVTSRFYRPVPEYIAGFGVMTARGRQ
ncbi:DODA-type extradiol aromatic ring-opening family dioxygenase [Streptomyces sp. LZ34]